MHNGLKIVGGSLLAVWVALNPAYALSQENKDVPTSFPQKKPSIPQDPFFVPVKDMNEFRPRVAERAAAGVSAKGIVVLVTGDDDQLLETVKRAARDAKQEGAHVLGIIDGGGDKNEVKIYLGGLPQNRPGFTAYLDIKDSIMIIDKRRHEFLEAPLTSIPIPNVHTPQQLGHEK